MDTVNQRCTTIFIHLFIFYFFYFTFHLRCISGEILDRYWYLEKGLAANSDVLL